MRRAPPSREERLELLRVPRAGLGEVVVVTEVRLRELLRFHAPLLRPEEGSSQRHNSRHRKENIVARTNAAVPVVLISRCLIRPGRCPDRGASALSPIPWARVPDVRVPRRPTK